MTDVPALLFTLLSIYFFVKSHDTLDLKNFSLSIFFLSLSFLMRNTGAILGFTYLIFLLITKRRRLFKIKNFWIGGIIGVIPILLFFFYNFLTQGSFFPALSPYAQSATNQAGPAYYILYQFFPHIFGNIFSPGSNGVFPFYGDVLLIFLMLGALLIAIETGLAYDMVSKSSRIKWNIFSFLFAGVSLIFFVFILKAAEDRYLLFLIIVPLLFISHGILFCYSKLKKYNKLLAILFLIVILFLGGYSQFKYGNPIIELKKNSYYNLKQAFLLVNENTPQYAVILGDGIDPYVIYYGERKFEHWNYSDVEGTLQESDYIVIAAFEHQSQEAINLINTNLSSRLTVEQAFFFDQQQKQPSAIIYKIIK